MPELISGKFHSKGLIAVRVVLLVLALLMAVAGTIVYFHHDPAVCTPKTVLNISLDALCLWIVAVLVFATAHDLDKSLRSRSSLFITLIFLHGIVLLADEFGWLFHGVGSAREFALVSRVVFCVFSSLITYAFWHYSQRSIRSRHVVLDILVTLLTIVSVLLCLANLKWAVFFTIDADGIFLGSEERWPLFVAYHAIVLGLACLLVLFKRGNSLKEKAVLLSFPAAVALGIFFNRLDGDISVTYIVSLMSLILLYSVLSVKRGKDLARRDTFLANQKVEAMVSQIQPDFMKTVLDEIASLCHEDSAKAEKAVSTFATFLRTNIDTLGSQELIPLSREVAHAKNYVELEQLVRTGSVEVLYEVLCADFNIPHQTIMPLVENAIDHGHIKGQPLHIKIVAKNAQNGHTISIKDDGCGFDVAPALEEAKKNQSSLYGVQKRIETMCNGTMTIESHDGSGTLIIINIPETEAQNS